jgi:transglutaminase-like putative cysteine protease
MVCDGPALAERYRAKRNPRAYLLEKAHDANLPLSAAARLQLAQAASGGAAIVPPPRAARPPDVARVLTAKLRALGERLEAMQGSTGAQQSTSAVRTELSDARAELRRLNRQILGDFHNVERFLTSAGLPSEIWARHVQAKSDYRSQMRAVLGALRVVRQQPRRANAISGITNAIALLLGSGETRPQQLFNPNRLPVHPAQGSPGPSLSDVGFGMLSAVQRSDAAGSAPADPPQAEDLAPNEDVQITGDVQALAAMLGNQPLQIFDWVRNNIEFIPTYGSVQGSEMTLQARRGNAFDIASLLIALLRAGNIPARYVVGTAEIPVAEVLDLVGGAETADVAQQLLGQGGVSTVAIVENGTVTRIRMDHVWVEAWIDFVPSRGAVNIEGDTWIPMDASLKQHTFTPPSGLLAFVPFDMATLSNQMLASATVDQSLGKITNLDQSVVNPYLDQYADQAGAYLTGAGIDLSNRDAVLGGLSIIANTSEGFAGTLPYAVVAQATPQATLPDSLRSYVTVNWFASELDRSDGTPSVSYRVSLPALNSHRLGVEFDPATPADAATLDAARTSGASSLPVYLVNVVPTITLDGAPVATGPSVGMGTTQFFDLVLEDTTGSTSLSYDEIAGDDMVFEVTGNGVTPEVAQARLAAVPATTASESLHQVALQYWMESDYFALLAGKGLDVHVQRLTSAGLFSSPLTVSYLFGSPRSGVYQSRFMDVKQTVFAAAGTNPNNVVTFEKQSGIAGSFMEAHAFDQFDGGIDRGISAVQLISDATTSGVPIYFITSSNVASVLPLLSLDASVVSDISSSVAAGKSVLVPEHNIALGPWSGVGYIVTDEATGAAAYLISGGLNGGGFFDCVPDLVPILVAILAVILLAAILWLFFPVLVAAIAAAAAELAAAMAALGVLLYSAAPAYAAGGLRKGGQADPCNCPPIVTPIPGSCTVDLVPPSKPHYPCPGDHWHYLLIDQGPAPACIEKTSRELGGCIPPPLPIPCPPDP